MEIRCNRCGQKADDNHTVLCFIGDDGREYRACGRCVMKLGKAKLQYIKDEIIESFASEREVR